MRLIKPAQLVAFARRHAGTHASLQAWRQVVRRAAYSLVDVRKDFPSADGVLVKSGRTATVFNIRGNNFRLITAIHYNTGIVYVMRFLTHREYSRDTWKDAL